MSNFVENASYRPNVNSRVVNFSSQQDFRGPVPKGDNLMGVLFDWVIICAGKSKIGKLYVELILPINQYILGFEVSVNDTISMAELKSK